MIQLGFPSTRNAPSSLPSSATSSSSHIPTVPLLRLNDHRIKGHFTEKIVRQGGMFRDNTLYAASKKKERQKKQFENTFTSLDDMMIEFEKEKDDILRMKEKIESQQQMMARNILIHYSALSIQLKWRSYKAKYQLFYLKLMKLIFDWVSFRCYYRKRCRAAAIIVRKMLAYRTRRYFKKILKRVRAVSRLQRLTRRKIQNRKFFFEVFKYSRIQRFLNHILLFGKTRALHSLAFGTSRPGRPSLGQVFLAHIARKKRMK
jgi:glycosyltransferase involved in cell wall biosynthesis